MENEIFDHSDRSARREACRLLFKEEDQDDSGIPIGPLYLMANGHSMTSKRYVTIAEAKHLSRTLDAELEEI